ncbi:hypothetical protein D3C86_1786660 [compost metagenome]
MLPPPASFAQASHGNMPAKADVRLEIGIKRERRFSDFHLYQLQTDQSGYRQIA